MKGEYRRGCPSLFPGKRDQSGPTSTERAGDGVPAIVPSADRLIPLGIPLAIARHFTSYRLDILHSHSTRILETAQLDLCDTFILSSSIPRPEAHELETHSRSSHHDKSTPSTSYHATTSLAPLRRISTDLIYSSPKRRVDTDVMKLYVVTYHRFKHSN